MASENDPDHEDYLDDEDIDHEDYLDDEDIEHNKRADAVRVSLRPVGSSATPVRLPDIIVPRSESLLWKSHDEALFCSGIVTTSPIRMRGMMERPTPPPLTDEDAASIGSLGGFQLDSALARALEVRLHVALKRVQELASDRHHPNVKDKIKSILAGVEEDRKFVRYLRRMGDVETYD